MSTSFRLLVAGDTHGNARWVSRLCERASALGCRAILQLGDFGWWLPERQGELFLAQADASLSFYGLVLFWVDGNHENHTSLRQHARWAERDQSGAVVTSERTRWLPRGHRWSWNGVRFGALGGAFSIDWHLRTPGVSWWPEEITTDTDVAVIGDEPLDVLVTHDAPAGFPANHPIRVDPADEARSYDVRLRLADAVEATRPRLVLHGHWHRRHSTVLPLTGGHAVQIEGFASDVEADHRSWGVLELPSLRLSDGDDSGDVDG